MPGLLDKPLPDWQTWPYRNVFRPMDEAYTQGLNALDKIGPGQLGSRLGTMGGLLAMMSPAQDVADVYQGATGAGRGLLGGDRQKVISNAQMIAGGLLAAGLPGGYAQYKAASDLAAPALRAMMTDQSGMAKITGPRPSQVDDLIETMPRIKAGDTVSGLTVGEDIANTSSIRASLEDYTDMGLREVPMSIFEGVGGKDYTGRAQTELANAITRNNRLDPLIVVVDGHVDGPAYILEGSHRIDAAADLGLASIPALVIRDNTAKLAK